MKSRPFKYYFLFIFLFASTFSFSQVDILDSIRTSFKSKGKLYLNLSTKNTFIDGFRSPILGIKIGVEFDRRVRIGGGFNFLKNPIYQDKYIKDINGNNIDTVPNALHFSYMSYFFEYIFYKTKHWEFSIPTQIGIGSSRFEYIYNGKKITENKKTIILYEPSIAGHYKVFKWLGVGGDIGYRLMLKNNKAIERNFNSPTFTFKVMIFYGEIYKALFKK